MSITCFQKEISNIQKTNYMLIAFIQVKKMDSSLISTAHSYWMLSINAFR